MKIRPVFFLAATVATFSFIGAEAGAQTPVCTAPTGSSRHVLDLGEYRGFYVMYGQTNQRYGCPADRPCTCDLLPGQTPNGPWKLAFSGAGKSKLEKHFLVELEFDNGDLKGFNPSHPQLVSRQGNRIVLSNCALRQVHLAKGSVAWGIEYWDRVNDEMKKAWERGQTYATNFIVDVPNNISSPEGLESLTIAAAPDAFFEVPTFMERDPCYSRGVRHK